MDGMGHRIFPKLIKIGWGFVFFTFEEVPTLNFHNLRFGNDDSWFVFILSRISSQKGNLSSAVMYDDVIFSPRWETRKLPKMVSENSKVCQQMICVYICCLYIVFASCYLVAMSFVVLSSHIGNFCKRIRSTMVLMYIYIYILYWMVSIDSWMQYLEAWSHSRLIDLFMKPSQL